MSIFSWSRLWKVCGVLYQLGFWMKQLEHWWHIADNVSVPSLQLEYWGIDSITMKTECLCRLCRWICNVISKGKRTPWRKLLQMEKRQRKSPYESFWPLKWISLENHHTKMDTCWYYLVVLTDWWKITNMIISGFIYSTFFSCKDNGYKGYWVNVESVVRM